MHDQRFVSRTVISAVDPFRYRDSCTEIFLKVWFAELSEPVDFIASPFDTERHGKELWIRAMAQEFGPINVIDTDFPMPPRSLPKVEVINEPKLLEYHGQS